MNRLYLVRHGETLTNITHEFSCRYVDYPLTRKGVLQAHQTAEFLADRNIHDIYSSPLKRAVETAQIIAERIGLTPTIMENFREINVGQLEGGQLQAQWGEYLAVISDWFKGNTDRRYPGGENYTTLLQRMRLGIQQITANKTNRNIVVVGHGGIFTVTLKELCRNIDLNWLWETRCPNCSITEMHVVQNNGQLTCNLIDWASYRHLDGEAAELVSGIPDVRIDLQN